MFDLYINTNPVKVKKYSKDKKLIDELTIQFPKSWIKNNEVGKSSNLFDNKQSVKFEMKIKKDGKTYIVENMDLLVYTTIEEFKYILASVLKIDYVNIINIYNDKEHNFVIDEDLEKCKKYKWIHTNDRLTDIDAYYSTTSIGYQKYTIEILDYNEYTNVDYSYKFYNNYLKIKTYITNMLNIIVIW